MSRSHGSLIEEYYSVLQKLASTKELQRKAACNELIQHIQSNSIYKTPEFDARVMQRLGKGFWENTTEKLLAQLETDIRKPSKSGGALREISNALVNLLNLYPDAGDGDEYKRPILHCGAKLLNFCVDIIGGDEQSIVFEACAEPCAKLTRRLLKVPSIVAPDIMEKLWDVCINALTPPENESEEKFYLRASQDVRKINHAEILHLVLKLFKYHLPSTDFENQFFSVCSCWISSLASERRSVSPSDTELMEGFADYLVQNRGKTFPMLCGVPGRAVVASFVTLMADRSVVKQQSFLRLVKSVGEAAATFAVQFGKDTLFENDPTNNKGSSGEEIMSWLAPRSLFSNLHSLKDSILSSEVVQPYESAKNHTLEMDKSAKTAILSDELAVSPIADTYARCTAAFAMWQGKSEEVAKLFSLGGENSLRRCQSLIVLHRLLSDYRLEGFTQLLSQLVDGLAEALRARMIDFHASTNRYGVVELYWTLHCVVALAEFHAEDSELRTHTSWSGIWDDLIGTLLPLTLKDRSQIMIHIAATRAAASVAPLRTQQAISSAAEKLWSLGFFAFPALDPNQKRLKQQTIPVYALQFVRHALERAQLDAAAQPWGFVETTAPAAEGESAVLASNNSFFSVKANSLRCELIRWSLSWALVPSDDEDIEATNVFSNIILSLMDPDSSSPANTKSRSLSLGETIKHMSALSPPGRPATFANHPAHGRPSSVSSFPSPVREEAVRWTGLLLNIGVDSFDACRRSHLQLALCAARLQAARGQVSFGQSISDAIARALSVPNVGAIPAEGDGMLIEILRLCHWSGQPVRDTIVREIHVTAWATIQKQFPEPSDDASPSTSPTNTHSASSVGGKHADPNLNDPKPKPKRVRQSPEEEEMEADSLFGTAPRSSTYAVVDRSQSPTAASSQDSVGSKAHPLLFSRTVSITSGSQGQSNHGLASYTRPLAGKLSLPHQLTLFALTARPSDASGSLGDVVNRTSAFGYLSRKLDELSRELTEEQDDDSAVAEIAIALVDASLDLCLLESPVNPPEQLSRALLLLVRFLSRYRANVNGRDFFFNRLEWFARLCSSGGGEISFDVDILRKLLFSVEEKTLVLRGKIKSGGCFLTPQDHEKLIHSVSALAEKFLGSEQLVNLAQRVLTDVIQTCNDDEVRDAICESLPSLARIVHPSTHVEVYEDLCQRGPPNLLSDDTGRFGHHQGNQAGHDEFIRKENKLRFAAQDAMSFRAHLLAVAEFAAASPDRDMLRSVVLRLCLAVGLRTRLQRMVVTESFFRKLMSVLCMKARYDTTGEFLMIYADYLWERFLEVSPRPASDSGRSVLDDFPHGIFGISSNQELLRLTLPSVMTAIFVTSEDAPSTQLMLEQCCIRLEPEDHRNMATRLAEMLAAQKANFVGSIHPLLFTGISHREIVARQASVWFNTLLSRGQQPHSLTVGEMATAVCRSLDILCSGPAKQSLFFSVGADAVGQFIANCHSSKKVDAALEGLNGIELMVHLSCLASLGKHQSPRSLLVLTTAEALLGWFDVATVAKRKPGLFRVWLHLIVTLLLRGADQDDPELVSGACHVLHKVLTVAGGDIDASLAVIILSAIQNVPSLMVTQRIEQLKDLMVARAPPPGPNDAISNSKRLVEMFPPLGRTPGTFQMSTSLLVSVSPQLIEAQCAVLLKALLDSLHTDWPRVQQWLLAWNDSVPLEREFLPNGVGSGMSSGELHQWLVPTLAASNDAHRKSLEALAASRVRSQDLATARTDVSHLLATLLELSGPDSSSTIRTLAAQCLSKLKVCFRCVSSLRFVEPPNCLIVSNETSNNDGDVLAIRYAAIEWLHACVAHSNSTIAYCAVLALKAIIQTEESLLATATLALSGLPGTLKKELEDEWTNLEPPSGKFPTAEPVEGLVADILRKMREAASGMKIVQSRMPSGTRASLTHHQTDALLPSLWVTEGKREFVQWITAVSDTLCRDSTITCDPVLRLLGPMCALEYRFAAMVFPWLVYMCVRSKENAEATEGLSQRFRDVLLSRPISQVHQLILQTLSFLRGRRIVEHLQVEPVVAPVTTRSAEKSRSAGKPTKPRTQDYRGFWLTLDLQMVAEVALRCEMPATAIMCIELLRDTGPSLSTTDTAIPLAASSSAFVEPTGRTPHEEILLKAYRLSGDSDAVSGIPRALDFRQSLDDRRLEGDWLSSVVGYDQLLLQSWATNSSRSSILLRGEATALARIGLVHCLQKLLDPPDKLPVSPLQTDSGFDSSLCDTRDLLCETQWRAIALGGRSTTSTPDTMAMESVRSIHQVLFHGLNHLRTGSEEQLRFLIQEGQRVILDTLHRTESVETLGNALSQLSLIFDLEQIFQAAWGPRQDGEFASLVARWTTPEDRAMTEEAQTAREGMLRIGCRAKASREDGGFLSDQNMDEVRALFAHLVHSVESARVTGQYVFASSALDRLTRLQASSPSPLPALTKAKLALQKAMICWADGDQDTALRIATHCTSPSLWGEDPHGLQAVRCLVGAWLANSSTMSLRDVRDNWFGEAIKGCEELLKRSSLEDPRTSRLLGEAHGSMASFVDRHFRGLHSRITSPEWKMSVDVQEQRELELKALKEEVVNLKANGNKARAQELSREMHRLERECGMDRTERTNLENLHDESLALAVTHYLAALHFGGTSQPERDIVFRVVHLWFNHPAALNEFVRDAFISREKPGKHVATAKLVPLVYQIVGRISVSEPEFLRLATDLVIRLACEHPWHTLPYVFALANCTELPKGGTGGSTDVEANVSGTELKSQRAKDILSTVSRSNRFLEKACKGLGVLYKSFIELAYIDLTSDSKSSSSPPTGGAMPDSLKLLPQDFLPLPVRSITVRLNHDYETATEIVRIKNVGQRYKVAPQGLSRPKIVTLDGDNGQTVRILVKGKDDLRQDAVMVQLLSFVSDLLGTSRRTRSPSLVSASATIASSSSSSLSRFGYGKGARDPQTQQQSRSSSLCIRTYNVLPMTPAAGLIEFVDDAISLGAYLYGQQTNDRALSYARSAHGRLQPGDYTFGKCMELLKDAHEGKASATKRLATFKSIKRHFHPVFRHFFFEKFGHDPIEWHERRDAYMRSTAANSMVGMILGIGDRHSQNILIDERTAEMIHIDFGITFEQGKTLRTPETVPFRLTADIVDGFGVSGVHGVFTASCEDTLAVLRENAEAILTICDVFVHDPFQKWTVNPLKQRRIENRVEGDVNEEAAVSRRAAGTTTATTSKIPSLDAERVLSRLRQKLQGHMDDGEPLSVTAQVKRAIQEATDEGNLSSIYYGWAPFL